MNLKPCATQAVGARPFNRFEDNNEFLLRLCLYKTWIISDEFHNGFNTNSKQRIDDHNNGTTYSTRARTHGVLFIIEAYINEQKWQENESEP